MAFLLIGSGGCPLHLHEKLLPDIAMSTSSGRMRRIQHVMPGSIFAKALFEWDELPGHLARRRASRFCPATTKSQAPHALRAISPPSTGMIAPVRNDAAGRHRLSVMWATSSGSP